jgi:BirA family biotin operon repressor/biotin-[acetyl-CoA-carboxylase] ligase
VKPLTFAILRLLSDNTFHSGEEMARRLGVSRASIWNALASLETAGIALYRVRGRGYRLPHGMDWLDEKTVLSRLEGRAFPLHLEIHEQLPSTNTALLARAQQGAPHGTCLAAECQTAGRGRRGRTWLSPIGGNLAFSLLWRFEQGAATLSGLSLAVGVAVLRALRQWDAADIALKWPNDILHQQRKLGGVLIELQGEAMGPSAAVIGVGLNLRLPESMREHIGQPVSDLVSACLQRPSRSILLGDLLAHLTAVLEKFQHGGFPSLRQEWEAHHAHQDRPVRLLFANGTACEGTATGVGDDGALLLATPRGPLRFTSGEVSLREAP